VFVVKGALIFPAAAALAWAVLAYACIDFGFFQRVFPLPEAAERIYRAGAEAVLAATLLVFLFAYLNLNRWHVRYAHVTLFWLVFMAALVGLSVVDPPAAAGVARISIAAVAAVGLVLVLHLASHGFDRAVMLIPTWLLLVLWVVAAGFTIAGRLGNDLVQPALVGGLVLIVMLIGFTVMQHAFAGGIVAGGGVSDTERRALALSGAGDIVFDWDVGADRIFVSPDIEHQLGLKRGTLESGAAQWLDHVHSFDRDHYRTALDSVIENRRGRLVQDFRLRALAGTYHWFRLKARPVIGQDGEVVRIIGTMADVTDAKTAEERLLHDAVHDNLTGLPNRQLFLDRLEASKVFALEHPGIRPTVVALDIDRFKVINTAVGHSAGDTILLTMSRRLGRLLRPQDTLARVTGDEFAVIILSETGEREIEGLLEQMRQTVSRPITHSGREIFLTASLGVVRHDPENPLPAEEMLKSAQLAMGHAKRPRRRPGGALRAGHAGPGPQRHARHGGRTSPSHRAGRDAGRVPAHRSPGGPHHRGLRGPAALGPSPAGQRAAHDLHPDRGGNRDDRRPRRVRAGAHRARARRLAARAGGRAADLRLGQCVQPAIAEA
jgi:diguanylate cyclase (GGDEF)-like protein/PAS domain S-box-containing protein